jgi:S-DNA-T family DNA segregation ATPase FtsK/SpoIIIE
LGQIRQQAKRLIPFGIAAPADESKKAPTSKTRAAKVPQAVNEGMSLDTKLDILGVGLVFGAFVLFTSSISYDQGTITGSINTWIKQIVGWGAIAIPLTMMAIGGWLIGRHFGDEAPKIDVQRLIGVGLAYLSLLVVFHYIESFDPFYTSPQVYEILQPAIIEQGRGGGQIGSLLYMFLLRNASELGGAVVVLGTLVISIMFITRTSAAELTLIVVSAWRSLRVSLQRRAQVREAKRLAQLQATPAAPPQISVQRPAVAELPAPVAQAPALPPPLTLPEMAEPLPIEERAIPIRMGGQMMKPTATAEVRPSEMPSTLPPAATPPPTTTPAPAQPGGIGGIAARLKGAVPSAGALPSMLSRSKPEDAVEEGAKPTAPEDSNRLRNLFGRKPETPAATTPTPTANTPPEEFFAPARPKGLLAAPAASAATETPATGETTPVQPTRTDRLNELRAGGVFNREQSASPTPEEATPKVETPAASVEVKPTTEVKPVTGEPRPGDGAKPAQGLGIPAVQPRPTINVPQAPGHTATPVTPGEPPSEVVSVQRAAARKVFNIPDYQTLLASGSEQDFDRETLVKRAKIIEETLQSFGAPGRVVEINTGPVITQFGVEPDYLVVRGGKKTRVKVSAIAQLDKDLQLALGAKSIRIEAPVPGKGYVGVEVPNEQPATVSLRDVMESKEFTRIKSPLAICLGQSVDGAPVSADLASMPHLLIAGTTGSGKSVCVNAIIASLLLRNSPEVLKFIMVDPKRVELTGYNGIPHLVAPVVVELERIVGVLKWVTREMDERYKKFSNAGARNIEDYNKHLTSGEPIMPYIVVIIDELADLMMLAPEETERTITRIAALARATGIHLVIATQRPSVDVVTGLIKANFPARIAFAVASGVDSRVILDQPGAERLLGRGDMLYLSGDTPAPQRLQGVYVSDTEINNMVRFWRAQQLENPQRPITTLVMDASDDRPLASSGPRFGATSTPIAPKPPSPQRAFWDEGDDEDDEDDLRDDDDDNMEGDDELYEEAVEMVRRLDKASVSLLQRRLRIGYTRAARLIDLMEERGVIGPATEGSKPRDVLPLKK